MNSIWKLQNGNTITECTSFPYAYRTAWNMVRKAIDEKQDPGVLIRNMKIISPQKDRVGDNKVYSYTEATVMAKSMGLLTPEGSINGREFKRRR